jgi:hypothetical protein
MMFGDKDNKKPVDNGDSASYSPPATEGSDCSYFVKTPGSLPIPVSEAGEEMAETGTEKKKYPV